MARKPLFTDADDDGFQRKGGGEEADLDITPMIDVTFLLLIFFMVTSTMQSEADLDVPVAKHGIGANKNKATIITIRANDGDPIIILGDGKGPEATVEEVHDYVDEGVKSNTSQVIIKAERDVLHGFVQKVARVVTEFEGLKFAIGVQD